MRALVALSRGSGWHRADVLRSFCGRVPVRTRRRSGVAQRLSCAFLPGLTSSTERIAQTCPGSGQTCPQLRYPVFSSGELQLLVRLDQGCSDVTLHVGLTARSSSSASLGTATLSTGLIDLGPVAQGAHTVTVQAVGIEGGCHTGHLAAWEGFIRIFTS